MISHFLVVYKTNSEITTYNLVVKCKFLSLFPLCFVFKDFYFDISGFHFLFNFVSIVTLVSLHNNRPTISVP